MTATVRGRLAWPLIGLAAVAGTVGGTRLSLSEAIPSLLGVLLTLCGLAVLLILPGLATLAVVSRRGIGSSLALIMAGSGIAAFADFWAWVASPSLGRVVAVALLVGSLAAISILRPTVILDQSELRQPLGVWLLVALAYVGLAYSQGGLDGLHWLNGNPAGDATLAISYRYWAAPDNTLPLLFAQRLLSNVPLTVPILGHGFGAWQTSDRPPLQTGFTLMLYPLFGHKSFAYELLGTLLQALWIPVVWVLLRSRGVSSSRLLVVILCTAATGAVFVNTIYVWPKMLAGAFALMALAVVLEDGSLILAGVLATLALLSHGGVAFSLPALAVIVWRMAPNVRAVARAIAAGALLYLPWVAYQRFLNPPGNRLLKWQIAGVVNPNHNSFFHDLTRQYLSNPLHSFVVNKLFNLERVFISPWLVSRVAALKWDGGFLGVARAVSLTSLVLAIGPLLVGFAGLGSARVRRELWRMRPLFLFELVSLLCWLIFEFGGTDATATTVQQGSYAVLILAIALAALTTTYLRLRTAAIVICSGLVWFAILWFPGLGFQTAQPGLALSPDWEMIGLGLASTVVAGFLLMRSKPTQDTDELARCGTVACPRSAALPANRRF